MDPQIWIENNKAGTGGYYNSLNLHFNDCIFKNNYHIVKMAALYIMGKSSIYQILNFLKLLEIYK